MQDIPLMSHALCAMHEPTRSRHQCLPWIPAWQGPCLTCRWQSCSAREAPDEEQDADLAGKPLRVRCRVWMSCQPAACSRHVSTLMWPSTGCECDTGRLSMRACCCGAVINASGCEPGHLMRTQELRHPWCGQCNSAGQLSSARLGVTKRTALLHSVRRDTCRPTPSRPIFLTKQGCGADTVPQEGTPIKQPRSTPLPAEHQEPNRALHQRRVSARPGHAQDGPGFNGDQLRVALCPGNSFGRGVQGQPRRRQQRAGRQLVNQAQQAWTGMRAAGRHAPSTPKGLCPKPNAMTPGCEGLHQRARLHVSMVLRPALAVQHPWTQGGGWGARKPHSNIRHHTFPVRVAQAQMDRAVWCVRGPPQPRHLGFSLNLNIGAGILEFMLDRIKGFKIKP